jgi:large subunit ribosomal protein L35
MPKMKRSSTAKKRFRWVGSGRKIKRSKALKRHLLTKKSSKRKRQLRKASYINQSDKQHIEKMMYY